MCQEELELCGSPLVVFSLGYSFQMPEGATFMSEETGSLAPPKNVV